MGPGPASRTEDDSGGDAGAPGLREVGPLDGVRARYWAITPERKLEHPAVEAILGAGV